MGQKFCRFAEQMTATQWCERVQVQWGLWTYNNERLNMAIGRITPAMKLEQATNLKLSTANPIQIWGDYQTSSP